MSEHAAQVAKQVGLLGLAKLANEGRITASDFDAAISHIEGMLQRQLASLSKTPILAKDQPRWQNDVLPKLQRAFECQMQAAARFHEFARQPAESLLLQGIDLIVASAEQIKAIRRGGALSSELKDAVASSIGDALGDSVAVKGAAAAAVNPTSVSFGPIPD